MRDFAELDAFVARNKERITPGISRARAIHRFRAIVILSERHARIFARGEEGSKDIAGRAKKAAAQLDKVSADLADIPALSWAAAELQKQSKALIGYAAMLGNQGWRRTDVFKFAFVHNLAFYWRRVTGKPAPKAAGGLFVSFVCEAFAAIQVEHEAELGRYVKYTLGQL